MFTPHTQAEKVPGTYTKDFRIYWNDGVKAKPSIDKDEG